MKIIALTLVLMTVTTLVFADEDLNKKMFARDILVAMQRYLDPILVEEYGKGGVEVTTKWQAVPTTSGDPFIGVELKNNMGGSKRIWFFVTAEIVEENSESGIWHGLASKEF